MRIQKYYNVFNLLFLNESDALNILKGWEHKEKVTEVYAIIEDETIDQINLDIDNVSYFKQYEQANEYLKDELEVL